MPACFATASMLVAPNPSPRNSAVATSRMRSESCADWRRDGRPPWPRGRTLGPLSTAADTTASLLQALELNRDRGKRNRRVLWPRLRVDRRAGLHWEAAAILAMIGRWVQPYDGARE